MILIHEVGDIVAFLNYEYRMTINYSEPVGKCYFTIKSIPADDLRQRSISYDISVSPPTGYSDNKDSFGNREIIGSVCDSHNTFDYTIRGLVETNASVITGRVDESKVGMYKYSYGKCIPGENIRAFADDIKKDVQNLTSEREKCNWIMELLRDRLYYEKGYTKIDTCAEEAFTGGKCVCQDFAHIYITLLRLYGIPARYVCGIIVGEGESHAWVEAAVNGNYIAFDPTYNKQITDEYIKLGIGRDAGDCAINRGVMWGGGVQTQEIKVLVDKYY